MGELPPPSPLPPPEYPKSWLPWTRSQKLVAVLCGFVLGTLVLVLSAALGWPDNIGVYGALAGLLLPIAAVDVSNRMKGRGGL